MQTKLYLVLSSDYGYCARTTVHATAEGAQAAIDAAGIGGLVVHAHRCAERLQPGDMVRVAGVSTSFDHDYTTAHVYALDNPFVSGDLHEVLP